MTRGLVFWVSCAAMRLPKGLKALLSSGPLIKDASASGNWRVLASLVGPANRGMIRHRGQSEPATPMRSAHATHFDWSYLRDHAELARLYEAAKAAQWNGSVDLDWSIPVDPFDPKLIPDAFVPVSSLPFWSALTPQEQARDRHLLIAWLLSQFLHGEQGALFAAAQVTEALPWMDGKLYASSQVADEGRHVEVFHRYLTEKLEKRYQINENLYVVVDALMTDSRWDMKFLGMQIMIEGLALGAFGMLRQLTGEPLLKQLLAYVIADEARHVHFGVLALGEYFQQLSERERRYREDWVFEISLMLRNRFLAHEFYDENYAHMMTRKQWDVLVLNSEVMGLFRRTMFKRIIPNLRRLGLISARVRPRYQELGLLEYENEKAAPELTSRELLEGV